MSRPHEIAIKWIFKNVSDSPFTIEEIGDGGVGLDPDEEVDLMDEEVPNSYIDRRAIQRCLDDLPDTSLYQGTHSDPPILEHRKEAKAPIGV